MDINQATFGYDAGGREEYLRRIQAIVVDQAAHDATQIQGIEEAVRNNWTGTAAEQFLTALNHDAQQISTTLSELYNQLVNEINNIGAAMADFDNGLMSSLGNE